MAVDYTDLFTSIGKIVKHYNLLGTDAVNLDTDRADIEGVFEAEDQPDKISGIVSSFNSLKSSHYSLRASLVRFCTNRIVDKTTIVDELLIPSANLATVIPALISQMNTDSESVDGSTVTLGSVTAGASNIGDGTVLISKVLDGTTSPTSGFKSHPEYDGIDSEIGLPETITLLCKADSYSAQATAGQERFSVYGEPKSTNNVEPEGGSGVGPSIATANASSLISNKDLENWTSNVPDGWTLDSGTAGTHVLEETTEIYRGSSSLEIAGDGAQATIQLSQTVSRLTPKKRYLFTARYKASAADTASQTFIIQFEGTGYTAASSEKVSIAGNALATSWTLVSFWVNIPADVPSDFEIVIKVTGTLNTAKKIYVDSIGFTPAVYHNGVAIGVVAGATPFAANDKFTFTVANDAAGTFQEFFRRVYKVQLPSDTGGSETIADSLAT